MIIKKLKTFFKKLNWFFSDRCTKCGGEVFVYSSKKAYCKVCGERN